MDMKKVAVVSSSLSETVGGIERALNLFSSGLRDIGYDVVPMETGRQDLCSIDSFREKWNSVFQDGAPDVILTQSWMQKILSHIGKLFPDIPVVLRWDGAISAETLKNLSAANVAEHFACSHGAAHAVRSIFNVHCETIYNGVYPWNSSGKIDWESERFNCVRATRSSDGKNLSHVYRLAASMPRHDFSIAGPTGADTENMKHVGLLEPEELFKNLYEGSHIALCTSGPENEGIPNSIIEPMSLGSIPVVYDTGEIRELVFHGWNGFVVENGRLDLVGKSIRSLSRDRKLAESMSDRARETVQSMFNTRIAAEKLDAIINRIS
jgi:glycosyltransferase involved in cell wall biosynthesis